MPKNVKVALPATGIVPHPALPLKVLVASRATPAEPPEPALGLEKVTP